MSGEKIPDRDPQDPKESFVEDPLGHVSRSYLFFLQRLFSAFPAGNYRWTDDDETTEIVFSDQEALEPSLLGRVPGVVAVRGPFSWANLGMDQMMTRNVRTGASTHTDLMMGSMTLNVISDKGTVATKLAGIIHSGLCYFRNQLIRIGGFHHVGVDPAISPEQPAGGLVLGDSDHDFVVVSVQSSVHLQRTWSMELLDADILEAVNADLQAKWALVPPQPLRRIYESRFQAQTIRLDD